MAEKTPMTDIERFDFASGLEENHTDVQIALEGLPVGETRSKAEEIQKLLRKIINGLKEPR